jgi:hypothetical protein
MGHTKKIDKLYGNRVISSYYRVDDNFEELLHSLENLFPPLQRADLLVDVRRQSSGLVGTDSSGPGVLLHRDLKNEN